MSKLPPRKRFLPALWFFLYATACSLAMAGPDSPGVEPANPAGNIVLKKYVSGLSKPVAITSAPNLTDTLFVAQQTGQVVVIQNDQLLSAPLLDISDRVKCCGERGLLGIAFGKDFKTRRRFYIHYSDHHGDTVIARVPLKSGQDVAEAKSIETLFHVKQPTVIHNGGQIAFGPDGYLYIALGDGGSFAGTGLLDGTGGAQKDPSGRDLRGTSQNKQSLLGKILRIDVSVETGYEIPPSNPFAKSTANRPEIWAFGLRNPWRFSFDHSTGDMLIADVGWNDREEISFALADEDGGKNYGWPMLEGSLCHGPAESCADDKLAKPILEYSHKDGCAVIGGYRYRGTRIPSLRGAYVFGDFCRGQIWAGTEQTNKGTWKMTKLVMAGFPISAFGEDSSGELYVADYAEGSIYQLLSK